MNHTQAQGEKKMNTKKIKKKSQASNPHQELQQQPCNKLLQRYHQIKNNATEITELAAHAGIITGKLQRGCKEEPKKS